MTPLWLHPHLVIVTRAAKRKEVTNHGNTSYLHFAWSHQSQPNLTNSMNPVSTLLYLVSLLSNGGVGPILNVAWYWIKIATPPFSYWRLSLGHLRSTQIIGSKLPLITVSMICVCTFWNWSDCHGYQRQLSDHTGRKLRLQEQKYIVNRCLFFSGSVFFFAFSWLTDQAMRWPRWPLFLADIFKI